MPQKRNRTHWTPLPGKKLWMLPVMLILSALSFGCSTVSQPLVLTPPESLLADCPQPPLPEGIMQSRDLRGYSLAVTRHLVDVQHALDLCNADKAALRQWVQEAEKGAQR